MEAENSPTAAAAQDGHDALRAELRGAMTAAGLSIAATAKLAGVAASTLSAWLAGSYRGDCARVAADARRWLDGRRAQARVRAAAQAAVGYVATRTARVFAATLEHAQYVVDVVVISGGAGVGKTTSCEHYAANNPNVWLMTAQPSVSSAYGMLERLCAVVGVTEKSVSRRSDAIARKLRGSEGLLIVDEAQHLSMPALDELRQTVHDIGGIGLALVGNEEVYTRLNGGAQTAKFAQISSRVGMGARRPKPLVADIDAILDAYGVAAADARELLRGVAAKPGALRGLVKTLRLARMVAGEDDADGDGLSARAVKAAWKRLTHDDSVGEAA